MTSHMAPGLARAEALASGGQGEAVVRVSGLRMDYGDSRVLRGVDLTARRGEILVLLGPNGAGKTTTVEILEGFRRRSAGEVDVLGSDPDHGDEEWRARIGVVLQSWRDHGSWRVRDLLHHFGRYYAPHSSARRVRPHDTDALLELVGLSEHAAKVFGPSREGSAAASTSPSASSAAPNSSSSTNPPPVSTPGPAATSTTSCSG